MIFTSPLLHDLPLCDLADYFVVDAEGDYGKVISIVLFRLFTVADQVYIRRPL